MLECKTKKNIKIFAKPYYLPCLDSQFVNNALINIISNYNVAKGEEVGQLKQCSAYTNV